MLSRGVLPTNGEGEAKGDSNGPASLGSSKQHRSPQKVVFHLAGTRMPLWLVTANSNTVPKRVVLWY